jgi:hypothetical protein
MTGGFAISSRLTGSVSKVLCRSARTRATSQDAHAAGANEIPNAPAVNMIGAAPLPRLVNWLNERHVHGLFTCWQPSTDQTRNGLNVSETER